MEYVPEMFQSLVGNWKLPKPDRDAFQKESCGSMTFDNDNVLNEVQWGPGSLLNILTRGFSQVAWELPSVKVSVTRFITVTGQ